MPSRWDTVASGVECLPTRERRCRRQATACMLQRTQSAGSEGGPDHWAMIRSLIQTAKLNDINPFEYIKDVLESLVADFPSNRIEEPPPWKWKRRN